jgi:hypothetical protein
MCFLQYFFIILISDITSDKYPSFKKTTLFSLYGTWCRYPNLELGSLNHQKTMIAEIFGSFLKKI